MKTDTLNIVRISPDQDIEMIAGDNSFRPPSETPLLEVDMSRVQLKSCSQEEIGSAEYVDRTAWRLGREGFNHLDAQLLQELEKQDRIPEEWKKRTGRDRTYVIFGRTRIEDLNENCPVWVAVFWFQNKWNTTLFRADTQAQNNYKFAVLKPTS